MFLEAIRDYVHSNTSFQDHIQQLTSSPDSQTDYRFHDGLLYFQNKIWLDQHHPFCHSLISEFHTSPLGGHMGFAKTLHPLQASFHWPNMRSDVRDFVRKCTTCQLIKYEPKRPGGLLQPISIPSSPWEDLSLDFITSLPPSHGYTTILVVVDRFTKGAHFGALKPTYSTHKVATLFLNIVCKLHGFPRSLISDRDPIFVGCFWRELFTIAGTQLRMSTSYHLETDGQTEVLNRMLEQYICCFVHDTPSRWSTYLSLA